MVEVDRKILSLIKKEKKKNEKVMSFNLDQENAHYLKTKVINFSKFVNDALNFYRMLINNPEKVMIELRRRNPDLWKHVNRKQFYPGGKF